MTAMLMAHFLESVQNFEICKPARDGANKARSTEMKQHDHAKGHQGAPGLSQGRFRNQHQEKAEVFSLLSLAVIKSILTLPYL
jgi:hypothetical protein